MSQRIMTVDGRKIGDGETVTPDHSLQTFTIQIRSLGHVGKETIKNLIEKKYEVVEITEGDTTLVVR